MIRDAAPPTVVSVHGVGMWPGLFTSMQRRLPSLSHRCWTRPGYGGRPMVADLDRQADLLAEFCAETGERGRPVVAVGVSGGATLALATVLRHPSVLQAVVTHEPLVGSLQPTLNARVSGAGEILGLDPSQEGAERFLLGLYGEETMAGQVHEAVVWGRDHWVVVCAEIVQFAAFEPSLAALAEVAVPHLTTVGAASSPERHDVARLLGRCGAQVRVLADCGHQPLVEAPGALADAITELLSTDLVSTDLVGRDLVGREPM